MAKVSPHRGGLWPVFIVGATVVLQLIAAYILDEAASRQSGFGIVALVAIGSAIALHGLRFALWGYAHRHYPLSHTYPMAAMFFPVILLISYLQGDPIGAWELAGTFIIAVGVGLMAIDDGRTGAEQ